MRFEPDKRGIAALGNDPELKRHLLKVARLAAQTAKRYSTDDTGAYDRAMFARLRKGRKAIAEYGSSDRKAWWMEFGTGPSPARGGQPFPARAPLRKAAKTLGLRFEPTKGP